MHLFSHVKYICTLKGFISGTKIQSSYFVLFECRTVEACTKMSIVSFFNKFVNIELRIVIAQAWLYKEIEQDIQDNSI